ncbi:uncharacterized protein LOC144911824 isoform X1 [Branchiostoma floridae x Branchiostoma belcheri]
MATMLKHLQTMEASGSQSKEVCKFSMMIDSLLETNIKLKTKNKELQERNKELLGRNEKLQAENEQLKKNPGKCRTTGSSPVEEEEWDKSEDEGSERKGIESAVVPCTSSAVEEPDTQPAELCETGAQLQEDLPHEDMTQRDGAIQAVPGSPPGDPQQAQVCEDDATSGEVQEGDKVDKQPTTDSCSEDHDYNIEGQSSETPHNSRTMPNNENNDTNCQGNSNLTKDRSTCDSIEPGTTERSAFQVVYDMMRELSMQAVSGMSQGTGGLSDSKNLSVDDSGGTGDSAKPVRDNVVIVTNTTGSMSAMEDSRGRSNEVENDTNGCRRSTSRSSSTDRNTASPALLQEVTPVQEEYADAIRELSPISNHQPIVKLPQSGCHSTPELSDDTVLYSPETVVDLTEENKPEHPPKPRRLNRRRRKTRRRGRKPAMKEMSITNGSMSSKEVIQYLQTYRAEENRDCSGESPTERGGGSPLGIIDTESALRAVMVISDSCISGGTTDSQAENKGTGPVEELVQNAATSVVINSQEDMQHSEQEDVETSAVCQASDATHMEIPVSPVTPQKRRGRGRGRGRPPGQRTPKGRGLGIWTAFSDTCRHNHVPEVSDTDIVTTHPVEDFVHTATTSEAIYSQKKRQHSEQVDVTTNVCQASDDTCAYIETSPISIMPQECSGDGRPPGKGTPKGRSHVVLTDLSDSGQLEEEEDCKVISYDTGSEASPVTVTPQKSRGRGRSPGKRAKGRSPHGENKESSFLPPKIISDDTDIETEPVSTAPQKRCGRGRPPGKRTPKDGGPGVCTDFSDTCGHKQEPEVYDTDKEVSVSAVMPQKHRRGRPPGKRTLPKDIITFHDSSPYEESNVPSILVSYRRLRPRSKEKNQSSISGRLRSGSRERLRESRILLYNSEDDEQEVIKDSALGEDSQNSVTWMSQEMSTVIYSATSQQDETSATWECHVEDSKEQQRQLTKARPGNTEGVSHGHSHSSATQEVVVGNVTGGTLQSVDSGTEPMDSALEQGELRTKAQVPSDSTGETSSLGIIDTESALRAVKSVMVISDSWEATDSQTENKRTDPVEELVQKAATSEVVDSQEERQHSEQEDVRTNAVCQTSHDTHMEVTPTPPRKRRGRPPGKRKSPKDVSFRDRSPHEGNVTGGTVQSVNSGTEPINCGHEQEDFRTKVPSDSTSPKPNNDQVLHEGPEELSLLVKDSSNTTSNITTRDQEVLKKFPGMLEKSPVVMIKRLEMTSTTAYVCETEPSGHKESHSNVQDLLDSEVKTTSPSMQESAQVPPLSCPTPDSSDESEPVWEEKLCHRAKTRKVGSKNRNDFPMSDGMTRAWTKAEVIKQVREHSLRERSPLHDGDKEVHQQTKCHIDLESALTAVTIIQKPPLPPGEDAETEKEGENQKNLGMVPGSLKIRVRLCKNKVDGKIRAKCIDKVESGTGKVHESSEIDSDSEDDTSNPIPVGEVQQADKNASSSKASSRSLHAQKRRLDCTEEISKDRDTAPNATRMRKGSEESLEYSEDVINASDLRRAKTLISGKSKTLEHKGILKSRDSTTAEQACSKVATANEQSSTRRRVPTDTGAVAEHSTGSSFKDQTVHSKAGGTKETGVPCTNRKVKKLKVHFESIPQTTEDTSKPCQKPSTTGTNMKGPDSSKEENGKTLGHAPQHPTIENRKNKDFGAALMQADCAVLEPTRQVGKYARSQPMKKKGAKEIHTSPGKVVGKCTLVVRTGKGQDGRKTTNLQKQSKKPGNSTHNQMQGTDVVPLTGIDSESGRNSGPALSGGCDASRTAEKQWWSPSSQQRSPTDGVFWSPGAGDVGADDLGAEVEVPFSPVKAQRGKNPSTSQTPQDGQLNTADTGGQSAQPRKKGGSTRKRPIRRKLNTTGKKGQNKSQTKTSMKGKSNVAVKGKDSPTNTTPLLSSNSSKQPSLKESGMQGELPNNTPQFTEAGQKVEVVFTSVQSPAMPVSLHGDSPLSPWKQRPPVLFSSTSMPRMAPLTTEKTPQQSHCGKQKTGKDTQAKEKQPTNKTVRDRRESQTDATTSQDQDIISAALQEAAADQVPDTVSGNKDAMNALNCTSLRKTGDSVRPGGSQQSNNMSFHMQLTPQMKVVGSSGPSPDSGNGSSPALTQLAEQCYPDPLLTMGCNKVMLENSMRGHHNDLQDFVDDSPVVNMHASLPAVSQEPQLNTTVPPASLPFLTFRSEQAVFTNMPLDTASTLPQSVFNSMPLDTVTSLPDISFTLGSLSTEKTLGGYDDIRGKETAMQEPSANLKGQKESVKTRKKQPSFDNGQVGISNTVSNIMPFGNDTCTATDSSICDIEVPVVSDKSCRDTQQKKTPPLGKIAKVAQHVPTSPELTIKRRRTKRKLLDSPPKQKPTAPEKFSPTPVLIDGKEKIPISRLPSGRNTYSYKAVLAGQPVQGTTTGNIGNLLVLANASDLVERLCSPVKVDVNRNNCQPMLHEKQVTEVNKSICELSAEKRPSEGSGNPQAQVLMAANTATRGDEREKTKDILEEAMLQITGDFSFPSPRETEANASSKEDGILKDKAGLRIEPDPFNLTVEELVTLPKPTHNVRKTATVTQPAAAAATSASSTPSTLAGSNKPADKNPLLNVAASTKPVVDSVPADNSSPLLITSNSSEMDNPLSMVATDTSCPLSSVTACTSPLRSETGEDDFVGRCPPGPPIRTSSRPVDSSASLPVTAANSMSVTATDPVLTNSTNLPKMAPVALEETPQLQQDKEKTGKDTQVKEKQLTNNTVRDRRESQADPTTSQEQDIISTAVQKAAAGQVPDTVSGTGQDATATNVIPTNSAKDVFMGHHIPVPSEELVCKNAFESSEAGATDVPVQEDCAKVKNGADDDRNSAEKRNEPERSSSPKAGKISADAIVTSNLSVENCDALSHTTSLDYSPDSDDNWEYMESSEGDVQDNKQGNRNSNPVQKDMASSVAKPAVDGGKKDAKQDKVERVKRSTNQSSSDVCQEPPSKVRRTLSIGKAGTSAGLADVAKSSVTDPLVGPHREIDYSTIRQKSPVLSDSPVVSSSSNSHSSTQLGSVAEKPSVCNSGAKQKTSPGSLASMVQKGSMKLKKLRPPSFQLARTTVRSTEEDTRNKTQADRPAQLQPSTQQGNGTVQTRNRASSSGSHPTFPWVKETDQERLSKLEQQVQTFVKDSSQQQMKVRLTTNDELMKMKRIAAGYGVEVALLHGWTILLYKTRKTKIPGQPEVQRRR